MGSLEARRVAEGDRTSYWYAVIVDLLFGGSAWWDPHLALYVGVFRTGELAARKRDEHGRVLAVAAILVAELLD